MAVAQRAYAVKELLGKQFNLLPFNGEWRELIGQPERAGSWLIWGGSTSGKTSFAIQLAKYLTQFDSVLYNSLEEGISESLKLAMIRAHAEEARGLKILDKEPINELAERLARQKSPNIIIIDSLQYTLMDLAAYIKLKEDFPKKLFIFISHADGKEPDGKLAKRIRYDCNVKIYVDGYMANAHSRYGGGIPYTIWAEGAAKFWGAAI